jgi:hypothetical protein
LHSVLLRVGAFFGRVPRELDGRHG